jgi:hypothetical protein
MISLVIIDFNYFNTIIYSILSYLFIFLGKKRLESRDEAVNKLLEITPNAIHLAIVSRHLMQWRQNKLDKFINPKQSFYGMKFAFFKRNDAVWS